jgi:hypothetical protein
MEAVTYTTTTSVNGGLVFLYVLVAYVLFVIPFWVVFTKAGQPGWAALIPIYDIYILLKIIGRPWWWLLLMLIPIVNLIIWIVVLYEVSKSFGHGVGFMLGLLFLNIIFWYILAFGSSRYLGPAGAPGGIAAPVQAYAPAPATQPAVPPPPPPPSAEPAAPPPPAAPAQPPPQAPPAQPDA